jgi:hypothetical protein
MENRREEKLMRIRFIRSLLLAGAMLFLSTGSFAQVGVSVNIAPPELPAYEQPICPGDGYIWTPGYWAWDGEYYWVPGTWVMAPEPGYLWTPGYWGWGGNGYLFNEGYWGLSVGFYGGIDYGFGYFGHGYEGGRWQNGHFFYNSAINRLDTNAIHNVYNERVNENVNRVSYNGGNGGINARASSEEEAAARGKHVGPVSAQTQHAWAAHNNPQQRLSANHGAPPTTASSRPNLAVHPKELPPVQRSTPNTGNPKLDQKYQKQQDKVVAKQNQDRQKLQQKQDQEHQQLTKQKAAPQRMQQVEQQHQQQTQQMHQAHTQQMQQVQQRQSAGGGGSRGGGRR